MQEKSSLALNVNLVSHETAGLDGQTPAIDQTFLNDKLAVLLCDRYENSKSEIIDGHEWPKAVADFIPFIDAYARDDDHEALARGLLARLLEYSYRADSSKQKTIDEFTLGVMDMLSRLRHVPDSLMRPRPSDRLKRQPSFFESVMGTIKRYKFMEALPETFSGIADAIIVGGSMGYGPFFSVRDGGLNNDPSDVDTVVVFKEDYQTEQNWQTVMASEKIMNADKVSLLGRLAIFTSMRHDGAADVISQRFEVPGAAFNMSAHFMGYDFFERMIVSQLAQDLTSETDKVLVARDYKPKKFEHPVCAQRSFDGSVHEFVVPTQRRLEHGYLTDIPAYIISESKLYLGLYQNLISPEFDVLYDSSGVATDAVNTFRRTLIQYIAEARTKGQDASLSRSHIRSDYFAPGRYEKRANLRTVTIDQNDA